MAWEERGSNRYYYRKVWRGGTCHSEYAGQGWLADLASFTDGRQRHERTMARLELESFIQEQRRVDDAIESYRTQVRGVVTETLGALGFHRHKGQWRLKREEARSMANEVAKAKEKATSAEIDEYYKLLTAANNNSTKTALNKLRDYADNHPHLFEFSTLASTTLDRVIDGCTKSEGTKIHLRGEATALKRSLGYATSTPMERLLINDIALCWLRLQTMEDLYTHNYERAKGDGLKLARYLEGRMNATRRRYLQSIEALARVRGLLARVGVQINVAQQQVVQNG